MTLLPVISDYLDQHDIESFPVRPGALAFFATGDCGEWEVLVHSYDDLGTVTVHSVFPELVPEDRLVDVALFITRANYGLVLGNFEVDMDTGELRFKTSVDVEGGELTAALVEHLVQGNIAQMDRYYPGIFAVVDGGDPSVVITALEAA